MYVYLSTIMFNKAYNINILYAKTIYEKKNL